MASEAKSALLPKLRFPEFRAGQAWANRKLGEIVKFSSGGTPSKDNASYWGGSIPWISASAMHEPRVRSSELNVTEAAIGNGTRIAKRGSLLVLVRGSMLFNRVPICIAEADVAFNQDVKALRLDQSVSGDFLLHQLLAGESRIPVEKTGIGAGKIEAEPLAQFEIGTPSWPEQQKIAECLNTLDELIDAESQKLDALKAHKKGLMKQLFPREGETRPRLRFPEFQNARCWEKMTLGHAATFYNGRAYKHEELLESGKYLVLRVGNFFTSNTWYYSNLELDESKYCEKGDLLYAWSASFGPRIWDGDKSIYHYHIWKVIEQRGVDKQFLFITLENETGNMKAKTTNGLGIMHITKGAIESWESAFPTLAEQRKIADFLTSIEHTIISQINKLEALKTHKVGLIAQLFPSPDAIHS